MSERARRVQGLGPMVGPYVQVSLADFAGGLGVLASTDVFEGCEEIEELCESGGMRGV